MWVMTLKALNMLHICWREELRAALTPKLEKMTLFMVSMDWSKTDKIAVRADSDPNCGGTCLWSSWPSGTMK